MMSTKYFVNIFKKTKDEFFILLVFPASLIAMLLINPLFLTTNFLFVVAVMSAAVLYFVIRWAFVDNSGNLGINATKYWNRRKDDDGMSWTHGSK